jgi:transposase InsO family protein
LTDSGRAYRSRSFTNALRLLAIRHIFTRPYTPKTNGKAERFIQTLLRECPPLPAMLGALAISRLNMRGPGPRLAWIGLASCN